MGKPWPTKGGESREGNHPISRGQIGDNLARFRVVGGCPPTTSHPIEMGLVASSCPGRFGCERLITQRSRVQIPPPQPSLSAIRGRRFPATSLHFGRRSAWPPDSLSARFEGRSLVTQEVAMGTRKRVGHRTVLLAVALFGSGGVPCASADPVVYFNLSYITGEAAIPVCAGAPRRADAWPCRSGPPDRTA